MSRSNRRPSLARLSVIAVILAALLLPLIASADVVSIERIPPTNIQGNVPYFNIFAPIISADGRYVTFVSNDSQLVPNDTNNFFDVFVYDRSTGQTTRVNLDSSGNQSGIGNVNTGGISSDGRYVTFSSNADYLAGSYDSGRNDVFRRDRTTNQTVLVSETPFSDTYGAVGGSMSDDGRYVVFASQGTYVGTDVNNQWDVFLRDMTTGDITLVSGGLGGAAGNSYSAEPSISADGRYIAFTSYSYNLVADDFNGSADIFVYDRTTAQTTRVSVASDGSEANGGSDLASLSQDGRYVVFNSYASNLVADDNNGQLDIFVHDRSTGQTTRVSVASDGTEADGGTEFATISRDGRYVAFDSFASNLVPNDTNGANDTFVHDRNTGKTARLSLKADGSQSANYSYGKSSLTSDGKYVAFTGGWDLVSGGSENGYSKVYVATDAGPSVNTTLPANSAEDVALDSSITINFSEPVAFSASSFSLTCNSNPVAFTVSSSPAASAVLTPSAPLPINANCAVAVTGSTITDDDSLDWEVSQDQMAGTYNFTFGTADDQPVVVESVPANAATGVDVTQPITITFNEPMNFAANAFSLTCNSATVAFTVSSSPSTTAVITPDADLPQVQSCVVTVLAANLSDVDSNDPPDTLTSNYVVNFTTADLAPYVVNSTPANNATQVPFNTSVTVNFNESVNFSASSFTFACDSNPIAFSLSSSPATSVTLTPDAMLPMNVNCAVTVVAANISDVDANDPPDAMAADYVINFATADVAPSVVETSPANVATGIALSSPISVTFSEPMNFTTNSFIVACNGAPIAFTLNESPNATATLTPTGNMPSSANCSVTVVAANLSDVDANDPPDTLDANYVFTFVTLDFAPSVANTSPVNNAAATPLNSTVSVTFTEAVNFAANSFTFTCDSNPVAFTLSNSPATTASLTPTAALPVGVDCSVTVVAANITDVDAFDPPNAMETDYTFAFSTTDVAPSVSNTSPANTATNVALNSTITINFSESVEFAANAFTVTCNGNLIAFSVSASPATSAILTPDIAWPIGATCSIKVIGINVTDEDSNDPPDTMAANYTFAFSTVVPANVRDTIGVFRNIGGTGFFLLRNENAGGVADFILPFMRGDDQPVAGDWNGDGIDTVGVYRTSLGVFILNNQNTDNFPDMYVRFADSGGVPVAGDFNGDGVDSLGLYRDGVFMLRNSNTSGFPDIFIFFGDSSLDLPVIGDWDGDSIDTPGLWRASSSLFYLSNQTTSGDASIALTIQYGTPADVGFVGDWDGDGIDSLGVYRPSNGDVYLRNALSAGLPDILFNYGIASDKPVSGVWALGSPEQPSGETGGQNGGGNGQDGSAPVFVPKK